jgi:hypothetical protein
MWALLWTVLVLSAVGLLSLLALRLFRQTKALAREVSAVAERLAQVSVTLSGLAPPGTPKAPDLR